MYPLCPANTRLNWLMTSVFVLSTIVGIPFISLPDERPSQVEIQTSSFDKNGVVLSYNKTFTIYVAAVL
jgi:hypothetical protein